MVALRIVDAQVFFSFPGGWADNVVVLVAGGACAFLLAYLLTFGVIKVCRKMGWLDKPEERRVHTVPVPRMGGIAMFLAFAIVSLLLYRADPELDHKEITIYWLFLIAATLIVIVHAYDDVKGLKPLTKLIAQTIAVIIVLGPWNGSFRGVLLFGFSNPFSSGLPNPALPWYRQPEINIFVHSTQFLNSGGIVWAVIPAVLFTWFWMAGMMNVVNWIDGVDGLSTGVVGLTAVFITIISWTMGQHTIALLSAIFTGAVLGFLPHNWNPAKIFMGDTGSQFLGLALAVLSIMGGAKVALALMVMGIPILDTALVIINRVRRGYSPSHADKTHLHHRFLATGLNARQICYILYSLTLIFGILALRFERIYKLIGFGLVFVTMAALIIWMDNLQRRRGATKFPSGGPAPTPVSDAGEPVAGLSTDEDREDGSHLDQADESAPGENRQGIEASVQPSDSVHLLPGTQLPL
jgi:UDP-GlcNAc:undecaprenyl-phosphate GlcNAc-1-phosphate transferase